MATILIYSEDKDLEAAISLMVNHSEHQAILIQSLDKVLHTNINFDVLILDTASWLSNNDWQKLDKVDSSIPIIATSVSHHKLDWIKENTRVDKAITTPWGPNELLDSISHLLRS
jgi:DNA-binding response OmpR family regulator